MPKISAGSVAEHVARQEAAVIDAASRLFGERGLANVSMGDIAREVGLARNSLYRYFPDKAHLLAAWFRTVVTPLAERCEAIAADDSPVAHRLLAWAGAQFEHLTAPRHAALLEASAEFASMPEDVRAEIGAAHRELYGSLAAILREAFADRRDRDAMVVTMFVASLVRSAAEQVNHGTDPATARVELDRALLAILDA